MRKSLLSSGCLCLLLCSQAAAEAPPGNHALIELRAVRMTPAPGYSLVKSADDTSFYVADAALVSDNDIAAARTDTSTLNGFVLKITLKPGAAARFHEFTKEHVGERLAVLLNGELSGTPPRIVDPISTPMLTLVGLPPREAQRFAAAVAARWHSGP